MSNFKTNTMKIKYILSSLIITLLIIYGCQKQNNNEVKPLNSSKNLTETTKKILLFKDKMKKAKQGFYSEKSGDGLVAIDSAEWYLEAAINYTYDDMSQASEDVTWKRDSAEITVDNDGNVDMVQLAEIYDGLIDGMVSENEYLAIADITVKEDGDKSSSKTVYLTAKTGVKGAAPPPPPIVDFEYDWKWWGSERNIETGEVWVPFTGSGYCNPPENEIINNQAAVDVLMSVTNSHLGGIPREVGEYWIDVEPFFVWPHGEESDPHNIWWEYENSYLLKNSGNAEFPELVYRDIDPSFPCMSPEEMDWFVNHGIYVLINRLKPVNKIPSGIITTYIVGWSDPDTPGDQNKLWHSLSIWYGRLGQEYASE